MTINNYIYVAMEKDRCYQPKIGHNKFHICEKLQGCVQIYYEAANNIKAPFRNIVMIIGALIGRKSCFY